mgnify:FL=1
MGFKDLFGKKPAAKSQPDVYADWPHRYIIHNVDRADADMYTASVEYPDPEEALYKEALDKARSAFEQGDFTAESARMVEAFVRLKHEELRLTQLRVSRLRRAKDANSSRADKRLTVRQYEVLQNARKREIQRLDAEIEELKNKG